MNCCACGPREDTLVSERLRLIPADRKTSRERCRASCSLPSCLPYGSCNRVTTAHSYARGKCPIIQSIMSFIAAILNPQRPTRFLRPRVDSAECSDHDDFNTLPAQSVGELLRRMGVSDQAVHILDGTNSKETPPTEFRGIGDQSYFFGNAHH